MLDENTMKVNPGTLVSGAVYNFTCTATNSQGNSGAASVLVKTLADPSGTNTFALVSLCSNYKDRIGHQPSSKEIRVAILKKMKSCINFLNMRFPT